jgi:hypothetical protein
MYFESFLFSDPENSFFSKKDFSLEEKSKKESFEEVSSSAAKALPRQSGWAPASSLPSQIIELGQGQGQWVRGQSPLLCSAGKKPFAGGAEQSELRSREQKTQSPLTQPQRSASEAIRFAVQSGSEAELGALPPDSAAAEKQILGSATPGLFPVPASAKQDFEEKMAFEEKISLTPQSGREESLSFSTNFQNSLQKRLQTKIVELAKHYNEESIEAVTNFFADILSFATLWFLLVRLEIQINITKSFLLEVFFGLDDSKKSLLILFLTDLLVGYHSPNIWELFFQTFFDHYGLPESQTTIFLLVATLPVLLDVLFKYLIFRHLNRASPATVATYHAMIE